MYEAFFQLSERPFSAAPIASRYFPAAAIENLANRDYRVHGSGLNEPGRNWVLTARTEF